MFISNLLVFIVISERQADRAKQQIQWLRAAISRCRECHTASSQETGTTGTKKAWNNMEHDGTASEWAYLIVLLVAWLLGLLGSYGHLEIRPNMSVQKSVRAKICSLDDHSTLETIVVVKFNNQSHCTK
jgi:hypothetical protein